MGAGGETLARVGRILQTQVSVVPDLARPKKARLWTVAQVLAATNKREELRQTRTAIDALGQKYAVEQSSVETQINVVSEKVREGIQRYYREEGSEVLQQAVSNTLVGAFAGGVLGSIVGKGKGFTIGLGIGGVIGGVVGYRRFTSFAGEISADMSDLARLKKAGMTIRRHRVTDDTLREIVDVLDDSINRLGPIPRDEREVEEEARRVDERIRESLNRDRLRPGRARPSQPKPPIGDLGALPSHEGPDVRSSKLAKAIVKEDTSMADEALYEMADVRNDSSERDEQRAEERQRTWLDSVDDGLTAIADGFETVSSWMSVFV